MKQREMVVELDVRHIHNNLMKLGASLCNVPQKLKKNLLYLGFLVHFQK
jgi:hypothetical protein